MIGLPVTTGARSFFLVLSSGGYLLIVAGQRIILDGV